MNRLQIPTDTIGGALAFAALTSSIWLVYKIGQNGRRDKSLPPGPPTIPVLGNLNIFPTKNAHFQFSKWAKEYGDVYSLMVGNTPLIVLSSPRAIREVMDERSAITSDRPPFHMVDLINGQATNLATARYNEEWKRLRRAAQELLTPQACEQYIPIQKAESSQLMFEFLIQPDHFFTGIQRYSASLSLSVFFGKRAPTSETKEVIEFFHSERLLQSIVEVGAQPPVDMIPILKYVPEWMGASWKGLCREIKGLRRNLFFGLLSELEERNAQGDYNGSCMEKVYERADEWKLNREMIGALGGVLVQGGSDTTSSYFQTLVLALVMFPEVQNKAQEEMDRVVGRERMPSIEDIDNLPYLRAVINETHRFRPVIPMGVPHSSTQDMNYRGYFIPAGSFIFQNIWGVYHDTDVYDNPSEFNPDRFLQTTYGTRKDATSDDNVRRQSFAFGAGRRICPGIHLAQNSIMIVVSKLLWGFNFDKAKDPKTGLPIDLDIWNYTPGLSTQPLPFECSILPRSEQHAEIIKNQFLEATDTLVRFEHQLTDDDRTFVEKQREALVA